MPITVFKWFYKVSILEKHVRRNDFALTSMRRFDVALTSARRHIKKNQREWENREKIYQNKVKVLTVMKRSDLPGT